MSSENHAFDNVVVLIEERSLPQISDVAFRFLKEGFKRIQCDLSRVSVARSLDIPCALTMLTETIKKHTNNWNEPVAYIVLLNGYNTFSFHFEMKEVVRFILNQEAEHTPIMLPFVNLIEKDIASLEKIEHQTKKLCDSVVMSCESLMTLSKKLNEDHWN